jgi:enoyl-CoA hydratase/carnithine racemase
MWERLPSVLEEIASSDARVLLVRGRGGHFCAGADITGLGRALADAGTPGGYRAVNALAEEALVSFPAPTVAVIGSAGKQYRSHVYRRSPSVGAAAELWLSMR